MAAIDDAIAVTQAAADRRLKVSDQHVMDMLADLTDASPEEVTHLRDWIRAGDSDSIGKAIIKRTEAKRRAEADIKAAQVWADGTLNPDEFLALYGR
jgi:hypothetical protein